MRLAQVAAKQIPSTPSLWALWGSLLLFWIVSLWSLRLYIVWTYPKASPLPPAPSCLEAAVMESLLPCFMYLFSNWLFQGFVHSSINRFVASLLLDSLHWFVVSLMCRFIAYGVSFVDLDVHFGDLGLHFGDLEVSLVTLGSILVTLGSIWVTLG